MNINKKFMSAVEISEVNLQEIATKIQNGYTSGISDSEEEDEEGNMANYRVAWELKITKFKN